MQREGALDADAEAHLADGEGLAHTGAVAADDDTLEDLDAGAVTLDDLDVHLDGVTGAERGDVGLQALGVELVELLHDCCFLVAPQVATISWFGTCPFRPHDHRNLPMDHSPCGGGQDTRTKFARDSAHR